MDDFFFFTLPEKWKLVSKSAQMVLTWQLAARVLFADNRAGCGGQFNPAASSFGEGPCMEEHRVGRELESPAPVTVM